MCGLLSIVWSVASKAAESSRRVRTETCLLSETIRRSFTTRSKAVWVLCPTR